MDRFISFKGVSSLLFNDVHSEISGETISCASFIEACCRNGRLDATGTHPNTGKIGIITTLDWRHLSIDPLGGDTDYYEDIGDTTTWRGKSFTGLLWSKSQIEAVVPYFHQWIARQWFCYLDGVDHGFSDRAVAWLLYFSRSEENRNLDKIKEPKSPLTSSSVTKKVIADWYRIRIEEWEREPPSRDDDVAAAKERFGVKRYGGVLFLRKLRNQYAPIEWSARGRRRKSE